MTLPGLGQAIPGDMLSCYTSSIAVYMELAGIDPLLVLGTQLFLAVKRVEDAQRLKLHFIHHHTPLRGERATHTLHLVRQASHSFADAVERMVAEWQRSGILLVVGDTFYLPWHVNYHHHHALHWFVISAIDEKTDRIYVIDKLVHLTPHGMQHSFSDWITWIELQELIQLDLTSKDLFKARERYAFGDEEALPVLEKKGIHWFEAPTPPKSHELGREHILQLLTTTSLLHTNSAKCPDLAEDWISGVEALRFLAEVIKNHLDDPRLYEFQDDLWAAARHRHLFETALTSLSDKFALPELGEVTSRFHQEIVMRWQTVIQAMEYSQQALQRGHRARALPITLLQELATLENEFMTHIRSIVDDAQQHALSIQPSATVTQLEEIPAAGVSHQAAASLNAGNAKQPDTTRAYVAPRTLNEELISAIWAEVLQREQIGIYDDFLQSGGNSLMAIQLIARLRDLYQVDLPLFNVKEIPTVADLAELLTLIHWATQESQETSGIAAGSLERMEL